MARRSAGKWADLLFPFTHWNWKVSLLTAVLRGLACVGILRHLQAPIRWHFGLVEAAFVLLTCGFFSAVQQQTLKIGREALAWLACVIAVPLTSLACDAGLHFWLDGRATCRLGVAALVFTVVSATLHWHMIRNGALLVGDDDAHSFATDLKRIPRLIGTYFAMPVLWGWRIASAAMRRTTAEEGAAA
jgi:hypothetical protein